MSKIRFVVDADVIHPSAVVACVTLKVLGKIDSYYDVIRSDDPAVRSSADMVFNQKDAGMNLASLVDIMQKYAKELAEFAERETHCLIVVLSEMTTTKNTDSAIGEYMRLIIRVYSQSDTTQDQDHEDQSFRDTCEFIERVILNRISFSDMCILHKYMGIEYTKE